MGRSNLTFSGGRVAIMTAKLFLDLDRPHRGIHLDRSAKLVVVGLAQVVEKLTRPGSAVAPVRIKTRIEAKWWTGKDRIQVFAGLQLLEFGVVLNAGQIHAVDFVILQ